MWETLVASFFFNLPLRVMTEAYVELCVYTFININNVRGESLPWLAEIQDTFAIGSHSFLLWILSYNSCFPILDNAPDMDIEKIYKDKEVQKQVWDAN